ncbi:hypothetical protein Barb7_01825 [Bacteroidales bacterium Barb7]|nr:hypothetical protein Barb7_01825 [Bacteroidales bacterium Barb7]
MPFVTKVDACVSRPYSSVSLPDGRIKKTVTISNFTVEK